MARFMYVGPTIQGIVSRNTTFEQRPAPLKDAIQASPFLASLCVPMDESGNLGKALAQIARKDGRAYELYLQAAAEGARIRGNAERRG